MANSNIRTPHTAAPCSGRPASPVQRLLPLCILLLLTLHLALAPAAQAALGGVRAAILINMNTGKVLFAKNANTPIPPASLTKVMTMYLTLDAVRAKKLRLEEKIRIRPDVARVGGSSMHLRTGEKVTVNQLLTGMAVASGNDAATTLALRLSGTQYQFVRAMNAKARSLGLGRTVFKNPTGLPAAGQKTTARDMAALARAYLRSHPSAQVFHKTLFFTYQGRTMRNTNALLGTVPGVNGLKTGWTVASGYNLIVTAQRGKTQLLAVVLGGSNRNARDGAARRLMEAGFRAPGSPNAVKKALGRK